MHEEKDSDPDCPMSIYVWLGNRWIGSAGMSRIPSIRRSYVVSQIGLIVVLLMAKTHNPSIRLCCDLFQMETRAVLMVLPDTISSELKIILEKYLFKYSQDQPLLVSKCRQGQLSLRS